MHSGSAAAREVELRFKRGRSRNPATCATAARTAASATSSTRWPVAAISSTTSGTARAPQRHWRIFAELFA